MLGTVAQPVFYENAVKFVSKAFAGSTSPNALTPTLVTSCADAEIRSMMQKLRCSPQIYHWINVIMNCSASWYIYQAPQAENT